MMKKLYGRKTSMRFQSFFEWARPIVGKRVAFYPSAARGLLGHARDVGDHVRVECDTSLSMSVLEAVAAHELMHAVLWREGFAKSDHDERAKGEGRTAAREIGRELGVCLSDPVIHHRLTRWGFTEVQEVLSDTIQNLIRRLDIERGPQPEAHTWRGKSMALAHLNVALSAGPERFAPVDGLLASRAPSVHTLVHRALDIVRECGYDRPETNWQALTRLLDLIDEPNVRLRRLDGTVYPPSALQ
jgi:hypothetical protein